MNLKDYLVDSERIVTGTEAYNGKSTSTESQKGTLACTTNRVVYVEGKDVIDISLNAVNSVEYKAPSYPMDYLYWGGSVFVLGIIAFLIPHEFAPVAGGILSVSGVLTLLLGLLYMSSTLKIHTPNKTYDFSTSDGSLQKVVHALRGYESQT